MEIGRDRNRGIWREHGMFILREGFKFVDNISLEFCRHIIFFITFVVSVI